MTSKDSIMNFTMALLATTGGMMIGCTDATNDEVSVTVVALVAFGFLLGLLRRRRAWLWAPLAAIWVLILSWVLPPAGLAPWNPGLPRTLPSYLLLTALVVAVSVLGAYGGVASRRPRLGIGLKVSGGRSRSYEGRASFYNYDYYSILQSIDSKTIYIDFNR